MVEADSLLNAFEMESAVRAYLKLLDDEKAADNQDFIRFRIRNILRYFPELDSVISQPHLHQLKDDEFFKISGFSSEVDSFYHWMYLSYRSFEVDEDFRQALAYIYKAYGELPYIDLVNYDDFLVTMQFSASASANRDYNLTAALLEIKFENYSAISAPLPILNHLRWKRGINFLSQQKWGELDGEMEVWENMAAQDHRHCFAAIMGFYQTMYRPNYRTEDLESKLLNCYGGGHSFFNIPRLLGEYYMEIQNDLDRSEAYFQQAKVFEQNAIVQDRKSLNILQYLWSKNLEQSNRYSEAVEVYKEILPTSIYDGSRDKFKMGEEGIAMVHFYRLAEIYKHQGQVEKDSNSLVQALEFYKRGEEVEDKNFNVYDESTLLQLLYYQNQRIEGLLDIYDYLYEISGREKYRLLRAETMINEKRVLHQFNVQMNNQRLGDYKKIWQAKQGINRSRKYENFSESIDYYRQLSLSIAELKLKLEEDERLKPLFERTSFYIRMEDLQSKLDVNEVCLVYTAHQSNLLILTISKDNYHYTSISYGSATRSKLKKLQAMQQDPDVVMEDYAALAKEMTKLLLPEEYQEKKIFILADQSLEQLSFEALISPITGKYLVEENDVYFRYDPQYINPDKLLKSDKETVQGFSFTDEDPQQLKQLTRFSELPGALREMEMLKQQFPKSKIYAGQKCNRLRFLKALGQDNKLVHLATHAISNVDHRDDIRLYLKTSDGTLDSLFAFELLNLDIDTEIVVLSACQTGTGRSVSYEGQYHWPRYLLQQGARRVVSTLWNQHDFASTALFYSYYQDWNMNRAKRQFLYNHPRLSRPFYWAGIREY
ncbi:hypothetical protein GCM10025777_22050 [Membranihabitans marinus]